jgi:hypothetical protein
MADDPILLTLTGIGLLLNVLSIKPLKIKKLRHWIKVCTVLSMSFGFLLILFTLIAQSSAPLFAVIFYAGMFLWNFGFFEIFFIIFIRNKQKY